MRQLFATFDSLTRARRYLLWPGLCSRPFLFKKAKIIRKRCQHALKGAHNANSHDNNNKAVDSCAASSLLLECLDDNPLYRYLPIGECLSTRTYRTLSFKMNSIQQDSITIELTIEALNVDRISFFDSIFIRSSRVGQLRKKRANTRFGAVTSSRKEHSSLKMS